MLPLLLKNWKSSHGLQPLWYHGIRSQTISSLQSVSIILVHICICIRIFVGHVMSPHHSDQLSQKSQVSRIALWRCYLNVFVFRISWIKVTMMIMMMMMMVERFLLARSRLGKYQISKWHFLLSSLSCVWQKSSQKCSDIKYNIWYIWNISLIYNV